MDTPRDLDILSGLEDDTLVMGPHEGYASQVVVFYGLFLHGDALFPHEPCTDTPHPGGSLIQGLAPASKERSPLGWRDGAMWL